MAKLCGKKWTFWPIRGCVAHPSTPLPPATGLESCRSIALCDTFTEKLSATCKSLIFNPCLPFDVAPEPITSVTVTSTSSSELYIDWQVSWNDLCDETRSYVVQYQLLVRDQCQEFVVDEAPRDWMVYALRGAGVETTLQGLWPYSTYNVTVATMTTDGFGTPVVVNATTSAAEQGWLYSIFY